MDFMRDLGLLALGSRLKRVSDRIMSSGGEIYRAAGIEFEPRWFPLFRLLAEHGPKAVGEAALALGTTHAAVSQSARAMRQSGLLESGKDPADERRSVLSLTNEGVLLLPRMRPLWDDIESAIRDVVGFCGVDILTGLDGVEQALAAEGLADRARAAIKRRRLEQVEIVPYAPEHHAAFRDLNVEWLERYFEVEPIDEKILADPEGEILAPGGEILFARVDGKVVGTCALIADGETFEVAKMAVTDAYQGWGIGERLLTAVLDRARARGAASVFLLTNSRLLPAVSLYRKAGFRIVSSGPHPKYARSDLAMRLDFPAP